MTLDHDVYTLPIDTFAKLREEVADPQAAMLGVHVLSESIFCSRAAVLALNDQQQDSGLEQSAFPWLGGLPTHDVDRIQSKLARLLLEIRVPLAIAGGLFLLIAFLVGIAAYHYAVPIAIAAVYFAQWPFQLVREIVWLRRRLTVAQSAARKEPDWSKPEIQPIEWWCLIRAGFNSIEKARVLTDNDVRLQGKPWRVLQREQFQYPVLVIKSSSEVRAAALRTGKLSRQQLARMVAYCCLLTTLERTKSSWAIVLFDGTD